MSKNFYGAYGFTGGSTGDLDAISGANLADKDAAIVINQAIFAPYSLDEDSGEAESSPEVISPDSSAGDKRWILQGIYAANALVKQTQNATALEIDNDGTQHGCYIHQDGVLAATKYGLYVYSNAAQVNSPLAYIQQDNASSTQHCLWIRNKGSGNGIQLSHSGSGDGLRITGTATTNYLSINAQGVLAGSEYGLYIYSNAAQVNSPLAYIQQDNASSDQDAFRVYNDGTGCGIRVLQNGAQYGIYVIQSGAAAAIQVTNSGSKHGMYLAQNGTLAAGNAGLYVYSNAPHTNTSTHLVQIHQDNSGASMSALKVTNDGSGTGVQVIQNGGAYAISIVGNWASGYPLLVQNDGNNANRYGIMVYAGADDGSGITYYLSCRDGDGNIVGYLENNSGTFQLVDSSDERLKENIVDSEIDCLSAINNLQLRAFNYKKSGEYSPIGLIANEVQPHCSKAISTFKLNEKDETDYLGLSKIALIDYLIGAVQQLTARIEVLEG